MTTQFQANATIHLHKGDLPEGLSLGPVVAVDTEAMGLNWHRDRLCLVQLSAWGAVELTSEQLAYAASDVLHLHALWAKLEALLVRENRLALAEACFSFLPARTLLDALGYEEPDIFSH